MHPLRNYLANYRDTYENISQAPTEATLSRFTSQGFTCIDNYGSNSSEVEDLTTTRGALLNYSVNML